MNFTNFTKIIVTKYMNYAIQYNNDNAKNNFIFDDKFMVDIKCNTVHIMVLSYC